jgi:hypothetical protein
LAGINKVMAMIQFKVFRLVPLMIMLGITGLAKAEPTKLESITVMAVGPSDGRAVVTLPDGKMQVLKIGDTVPGTQAIVMQVLPDKLVVEETIEKSDNAPVKQMVWIYKPGKPGEKSRIQRLDQVGPDKVLHQRPSAGISK